MGAFSVLWKHFYIYIILLLVGVESRVNHSHVLSLPKHLIVCHPAEWECFFLYLSVYDNIQVFENRNMSMIMRPI